MVWIRLEQYMTKTLEEVTRQAVQLSRQQRLALAGILLELDDSGDTPEAETAWEEEIRSRIQAIDGGTAVGIPYEEVMRQAQDRLAQ